MFKFIKRFFGLDYNEPKKAEPKKELPKEFAPLLDAMTPKPIDRTVAEKKELNPMDPLFVLSQLDGKKKKPVAKKPAAKKAAPKKAPPKR
jgi:hypothetical protein